MNVLVTGGGGFLGRYVVEMHQARGDHVRTLSRGDYPELRAAGVETRSADIRHADAVHDACTGMDVVHHTAAIAGIGGRWNDYFEINTVGTRNVIEGCRRAGVRCLVYTSSPSVTFDGRDQCGVGEEDARYPSRFLAHYPRSKALAEQEVLAANEPNGLKTSALRPHLIWGPRDNHLIPRLIRRARAGRLRRVGNGTNLVDMIYVENAACAQLLAADALLAASRESTVGPAGRAYFLSQGEPVNCWDWINEILSLAGLAPIRRGIPLAAAKTLGAVFEAAYSILRLQGDPPMTRFLASQLATSHYFDISAARSDFDYKPRISTEEGMSRLGEWILSAGG